MTSEEQLPPPVGTPAPPPGGVGAQLRAARVRAGLSVEEVAQHTRIARRYIESIESADFAALPGRTYAIGFSKSYARLVGLDQADVAAMVETVLDSQQLHSPPRAQVFEPGDPARVPPSRLIAFSLLALVVLLVGLFFAARQMFAPAAELPSLVGPEPTATVSPTPGATANPAARAVATVPAGPVVFTALEEGIWVRFYTAAGVQLMTKLMDKGERFTVPAETAGPLLWTGRPDALAITIGGRPIPRLADSVRIMRDVPIDARALLARPALPVRPGANSAANSAAMPAADPGAAPTTSASPRPTFSPTT